MLAALFMGLAALFLIVPQLPESGSPPPLLEEENGAQPPSSTAAVSLIGGRGRLSGELPPVAASPEPEETAAPTAEPEETEEPDDTPRPRRSRRPSASPRPGDPGGTEGGTGSVPGAGGTGSGENLLPDKPPALLAGWDRITFRVVDSRTRRTMSGVCVVIGTADCEPTRPHTNTKGLWWLDLPRGERDQPYDLMFFEDGYLTFELKYVYEPGRNVTVEIRMIRRR
jgi:hypothetical protein